MLRNSLSLSPHTYGFSFFFLRSPLVSVSSPMIRFLLHPPKMPIRTVSISSLVASHPTLPPRLDPLQVRVYHPYNNAYRYRPHRPLPVASRRPAIRLVHSAEWTVELRHLRGDRATSTKRVIVPDQAFDHHRPVTHRYRRQWQHRHHRYRLRRLQLRH